MTQENTEHSSDAVDRAAKLFAEAMVALHATSNSPTDLTLAEIKTARLALEDMARRMDHQLTEERDQRLLLAGQLTSLATALDSLVSHLYGLSQLMAELLERLTGAVQEPVAPPAANSSEPPFAPGGEGMTLTLLNVPGFQALMDFQKAMTSLDQVAGVSVERFQEGDSRLLVRLKAPLLGSELAATLSNGTGHVVAVEESRPQLQSLRLRVVSSSR